MTPSPPTLVKRTLRVRSSGDGPLAAALLGQMAGVQAAVFGSAGLKVEYDLKQVMLSQLEGELVERGIPLKGRVHRLHRALWKFIERNEQENAAHPINGACCNRPPPRS